MIAIAGGKGGTGKTTTTLGLARALVDCGRKPVLAVDADREMPDLHSLAGVTPRSPAKRRPDFVAIEQRMIETLPGLHVLPADSDEPVQRPLARLEAIGAAAVRTGIAHTLLDCPAGVGRDATAPLDAAAGTVLVSTPEPASLRDTAKTAAMSRTLGTPVLGTVVTGTDRRPAGIERLLETDVITTIPNARQPLSTAAVQDAYEATAVALFSGTNDLSTADNSIR